MQKIANSYDVDKKDVRLLVKKEDVPVGFGFACVYKLKCEIVLDGNHKELEGGDGYFEVSL